MFINLLKTLLRIVRILWYNMAQKYKRGVSKMSASSETGFGEIDSVDFAIYLNKKAHEFGIPVVNVTKIQKWLYICYGLYLAVYEKQLLSERPKAWDYGPAFPRVHKMQKKHDNSLDYLQNILSKDNLKKYDDVIKATLDNFGSWTASELVDWTHEEGKAWYKTKKSEGMYSPMDNYDILLDFQGLISNG